MFNAGIYPFFQQKNVGICQSLDAKFSPTLENARTTITAANQLNQQWTSEKPSRHVTLSTRKHFLLAGYSRGESGTDSPRTPEFHLRNNEKPSFSSHFLEHSDKKRRIPIVHDVAWRSTCCVERSHGSSAFPSPHPHRKIRFSAPSVFTDYTAHYCSCRPVRASHNNKWITIICMQRGILPLDAERNWFWFGLLGGVRYL